MVTGKFGYNFVLMETCFYDFCKTELWIMKRFKFSKEPCDPNVYLFYLNNNC